MLALPIEIIEAPSIKMQQWFLIYLLPPLITGALVWLITFYLTNFLNKRKEKEDAVLQAKRIYCKLISSLSSFYIVLRYIGDMQKPENLNKMEVFGLRMLDLEILDYEDVLFIERIQNGSGNKIGKFMTFKTNYITLKQSFLENFKSITDFSKEFNSYAFREMKYTVESCGLEHTKTKNIQANYTHNLNILKNSTELIMMETFKMIELLSEISKNKLGLELDLHNSDNLDAGKATRELIRKKQQQNS